MKPRWWGTDCSSLLQSWLGFLNSEYIPVTSMDSFIWSQPHPSLFLLSHRIRPHHEISPGAFVDAAKLAYLRVAGSSKSWPMIRFKSITFFFPEWFAITLFRSSENTNASNFEAGDCGGCDERWSLITSQFQRFHRAPAGRFIFFSLRLSADAAAPAPLSNPRLSGAVPCRFMVLDWLLLLLFVSPFFFSVAGVSLGQITYYHKYCRVVSVNSIDLC